MLNHNNNNMGISEIEVENETAVWYQVIDGFIFPLDVIKETPKTIVLKCGNRIMKSRDVAPCFNNYEEAAIEAVRNLEDQVRHHEEQFEYHKRKFIECSAKLAELEA